MKKTMFVISGTLSDMMYMVYYELIGRESYHIVHKYDVYNENKESLYVEVNNNLVGKFRDICHAYRINIDWSKETTA